MKQIETPLTWMLSIVFIAYIGTTNFCAENKNSAILSTEERNKNLPAISTESINQNMPAINNIIIEEEILNTENIEITTKADSILELADSLSVNIIEELEK